MRIVKVKKWLQIKKIIERLDVLFSVTKEFTELQENNRREALKEKLSEADENICIIAINEINRRIIDFQKKQVLMSVENLIKSFENPSIDYYEQRDKSGI